MKPTLERVNWQAGSSVAMLDRRLADAIPFQWHHHPEYELTLTLNSSGQRFIGDHVAAYADGDLVLVGPNLPHTWASESRLDPDQPHHALVIWFRAEWAQQVADTMSEFAGIMALLAHGDRGLAFSPDMARAVRGAIGTFFSQPPAQRVFTLLGVLAQLGTDAAAVPLASRAAQPVAGTGNRARLDRVLDYIHRNYASPLRMATLADIAALSESGLHRMFRANTHSTVSGYISALRIGDACALLSGSNLPIAHIADRVGFHSLANFNRQFKDQKHMTPRAYRAHFRPAQRPGMQR